MRVVARITAMGGTAGLIAYLCPHCGGAVSALIDAKAWENYRTATPRVRRAHEGDDHNH
jgi:hypothetical protein